MLNIDRTDGPDTVWHVGSRVNWQAWHLETEHAFDAFVGCFERSLICFGMDLLAFVVMSNHYHAVLRSPSHAEYRRLTGRKTACRHYRPFPSWHEKSTVVGQCIQQFKVALAKRMQRCLGLTGHFWDGRHFRRKVTNPELLVVLMAYDHRNPLREGMVARPEEYARSSAPWWSGEGSSALPLCRRADLPFGLTLEALRGEVLRYQRSKHLDDVMEAFDKSGLTLDSLDGRDELRRMLRAAGLEPPTVCHADLPV